MSDYLLSWSSTFSVHLLRRACLPSFKLFASKPVSLYLHRLQRQLWRSPLLCTSLVKTPICRHGTHASKEVIYQNLTRDEEERRDVETRRAVGLEQNIRDVV